MRFFWIAALIALTIMIGGWAKHGVGTGGGCNGVINLASGCVQPVLGGL
jgi:hypothetical protein